MVMKIVVRLTAEEISALCSCINETLEVLSDDELSARVGLDRQSARGLLGRLTERRAAAKPPS